jgi:predicted transcriptional regulator
MRTVWTGGIPQPFVVRDMHRHLAELAYTTVMTTLNRLADKGLLVVEQTPRKRSYAYRAAGGPREFMAAASAREVEEVVGRYGEAALAAFAARLDGLTPAQRKGLEDLAGG